MTSFFRTGGKKFHIILKRQSCKTASMFDIVDVKTVAEDIFVCIQPKSFVFERGMDNFKVGVYTPSVSKKFVGRCPNGPGSNSDTNICTGTDIVQLNEEFCDRSWVWSYPASKKEPNPKSIARVDLV